MHGSSITAVAPAPWEHRISKLEDDVGELEVRVDKLANHGARVDERTGLILESLRRIEERVYQTNGDVRTHGGAQDERHHARAEHFKTITLIFTALTSLAALVGIVIRNL